MEFQLAKDLEQAFNQVGASMMSDEFAAKLLAYVYVCGGGNEMVVYHEGLNAGIAIAQQKFNIFGGEIPKPYAMMIKWYVTELEIAEDTGFKVDWIEEINKRYNVELNVAKIGTKIKR